MGVLQDFCLCLFRGTNKEDDFGDCFKLLCPVCPVNILLLCSSLFLCRKLLIATLLERPSFILSKLQVSICVLIFLELLPVIEGLLIHRGLDAPVIVNPHPADPGKHGAWVGLRGVFDCLPCPRGWGIISFLFVLPSQRDGGLVHFGLCFSLWGGGLVHF